MVYAYDGILLGLRKEILTYATKQMNPEDIILREISQSPKDKLCMIPLTYDVPSVVQFIETESRMVISSRWGRGE